MNTKPQRHDQTDHPLPLSRWAWGLMDAWTISGRDLQHWRQQPGVIILNWLFPVMIVLMFGLLFGGAIQTPEGIGYFEFLMPGMFVMTMLFGLENTMLAVTTDAAKGVTDRLRSLPIHAAAVVFGRCIADMLNSLVGLTVMIVTGLLLGWRWHGSLGAAAGAVGLLLLLRFALLWIGIYAGLKAKGPESVTAIQILVWPLSFLSNIFVDPTTMPAWVGAIAQWNPLSATALATRQLFRNVPVSGATWATQHAVLLAVMWPALLVIIFLPLAAYQYRRLNH